MFLVADRTLLLFVLVAGAFACGLVIVDLQDTGTLSGAEQFEVAANSQAGGLAR